MVQMDTNGEDLEADSLDAVESFLALRSFQSRAFQMKKLKFETIGDLVEYVEFTQVQTRKLSSWGGK